MNDESFQIEFLPGVPPEEGGCPPVRPRVERADGMLIERDTAVRMRDGSEIYVDVFRPDPAAATPGIERPAAAPAIVAWGPYGKHAPVSYDLFPNHGIDPAWISPYAGFEAPDPLYWTRHGYAVINADPRGMWRSPGDATFFSAQETRDLYDLIEWAAAQPWSNGKVGMSGVSYLAMIQWHVAAAHPPHLAAINPWEGVSDRYREMNYHGGIPEDRFGPMWRARRVPYSTGRVEDTVAMYAAHPLLDAYWEQVTPRLAEIRTPAFVVASWSDQGLHTRGTIEGFKRIASEHKWLLVHGRKKWGFYYEPRNVELLRQFFDRFLMDHHDSGLDAWPRVRVEVRQRLLVGDYRDDERWPLTGTEHRALYLDAGRGELVSGPVGTEAEVRYDAREGRAEFTHRFARAVELVGSTQLRLWVQADGAPDMDLFVALQKLDADGAIVPFSYFNSLEDGPVALGWLRVSHRELDPALSAPGQPWHSHRRELPLEPGEVVAVDIEVWPSGTRFEAGEQLRLIVQGSDVYKYPPGVVTMAHSQTRNAGTHIIHAGGRYDSHLLVPVIGSENR